MQNMKLRPFIILAATLTVLAFHSVAAFASESYELVAEWGSYGSEESQFIEAQGIAVGPEGNIYVTDTQWNCRIQKFTPEGEFITSWGQYGSEDGEFIAPWGIDIDTEGNVYVADMLNDRIQKFTSGGEFITKWSTNLEEVWMYSSPFALAVDQKGSVYVQHSALTPPGIYKNSIQKFTTDGTFITEWSFIWFNANQMVTDSTGTLYVPAIMLGPVQKFNGDGTLLERWSSCSLQEAFCMQTGIAIDDEENVYISDPAHHRIKKYTANGKRIASWKLTGPKGFGAAPSPRGLAVDKQGYVYVIDTANSRIQKYAKTTTTTTTLCPLEKLYGEDSREIKFMRYFRDNVLNKTQAGKELVKVYYQWSPAIVNTIKKNETLKNELRLLLDEILR
jgi:DNA-binding beta-propeller fold protein YncE